MKCPTFPHEEYVLSMSQGRVAGSVGRAHDDSRAWGCEFEARIEHRDHFKIKIFKKKKKCSRC